MRYRYNRGRKCSVCGCGVAYDRELPFCGPHTPEEQPGNARVTTGAIRLSGKMYPVRKRVGMSQQEVGRISKLGGRYVSKLERGDRLAGPDTVRVLAAALGVSVLELRGEA